MNRSAIAFGIQFYGHLGLSICIQYLIQDWNVKNVQSENVSPVQFIRIKPDFNVKHTKVLIVDKPVLLEYKIKITYTRKLAYEYRYE
jgi:hypothetical protein